MAELPQKHRVSVSGVLKILGVSCSGYQAWKQRILSTSELDAVWVSDIAYIWTYSGFVYLTSIMDLYSRKIIAWVLSQTLEAVHVVECVEKAKRIRGITSPLFLKWKT